MKGLSLNSSVTFHIKCKMLVPNNRKASEGISFHYATLCVWYRGFWKIRSCGNTGHTVSSPFLWGKFRSLAVLLCCLCALVLGWSLL